VSDHWLDRALHAAGAVLAVALPALTIARAARAWPREAHLGYAEGIWLGLANDVNRHVFYRPLQGPLGYGGTRYFPLFFLLHAALIRIGLDPIVAGYLLAASSVALLVVTVLLFLRMAGGSVLLCAAAAAVVLSCQPVQMAALTIRGDGLPAALTLLGLACCLPGSRLRAAPLCFALAFAAKPTSLYGAVAAVATLVAAGQRSDAWRVAWQSLVGVLTVLILIVVASDARAIGVFAASATGGGNLSTLFAAPVNLARVLRRVPESTFFIQLAAASLLAGIGRRITIERLAFVVCLVTTLTIYASPATVENHLIDLTVLGVVVVAGWASREPRWTRAALAIVLVGGVSSAAVALWRFSTEDPVDLKSSRRAVVDAIVRSPSPILVEHPMLAAERGEPPYLLDPHIFAVRVAREPAVLNQLLSDLDKQRFGAIVLEDASLDRALADSFPGEAGDRFRAALERTYRLDAIVSGRPVYRPK
jgi:hypothetical protein